MVVLLPSITTFCCVLLFLSVFTNASIIPQGRKSHIGESYLVNGVSEMVVFGGKGHAKDYYKYASGPILFNDVWTLRIDRNLNFHWKFLEPPKLEHLPVPRWKSTGDVDDDRLIVFGGHDGSSETEGMMNDLWTFDTQKVRWTKLKTKSTPRSRRAGASAFLNHDNFVVFGGKGNGEGEQVCLSDTWELPMSSNEVSLRGTNVTENVWMKAPGEFPSACRWGHSTNALTLKDGSEVMVMYGGRNGITGAYYTDMWIFNPRASPDAAWERVKYAEDSPVPVGRNHHAAAVVGSMLYMSGGRIGDGDEMVVGSLWRFDFATSRWALLVTSEQEAGQADADTAAQSAMPVPRWLHSLVPWRHSGDHVDSLVLFGGESVLKPLHRNDLWMFTLGDNTWREVSQGGSSPYATGQLPHHVVSQHTLTIVVTIVSVSVLIYAAYTCVHEYCMHRQYQRIVK